jgi:hypothetical protein
MVSRRSLCIETRKVAVVAVGGYLSVKLPWKLITSKRGMDIAEACDSDKDDVPLARYRAAFKAPLSNQKIEALVGNPTTSFHMEQSPIHLHVC